jgi:N-acetylmuramoyl-L-alanine amidase
MTPLLGWLWFAAFAPGLHTVVVDPGHGGLNEGALCPMTGQREKLYTLRIAKAVGERLRAAGVKVVLTREDDRDVSLADRVRLANEADADLLVSIHLNSSPAAGPVGHETYFLSVDATDEAARRLAAFENAEAPTTQPAADPGAGDVAAILQDLDVTRAQRDAQALAAALDRHLASHSPYPARGVKQAPFAVLMGARMPAVVCEVGFINHKDEGRFVTGDAGEAEIAKGIAEGVLEFGRLVLAPREKGSPP